MSSRNIKKQNILRNFLSLSILILFIVCESLYFNVIFKSDFKTQIDNLPNNIYNKFEDLKKGMTINNSTLDNNLIDTSEFINNLSNNDENENNSLNQSDQSIAPIENQNIIENIAESSIDIIESETSIEKSFDKNTLVSIKDKKLKFSVADLDYFNNSLFIGDSRMSGFEIYKKLPGASYFCYSSASVFNIFDKEDKVENFGNVKLLDLLSAHKYDKIYIMLGINNLQTNFYNHKQKYKEVLDTIADLQPGTIIYLIANFHVTDVEDLTKPFLTNKNIDDVNNFIKNYADNAQIFYLDANPMYDDEFGNLRLEYSTDNIHIHVVHYDKFLVYLLNNALVEDTNYPLVIGP